MTASTSAARTRAEPAADTAPTFTARLVEASIYVLIGRDGAPDITFLRGQEVAVPEQVYAHLSEQFRIVTHREPGRIVQERRRIFLLRSPDGNTLPRTIDETVRHLDGADEPDPWSV